MVTGHARVKHKRFKIFVQGMISVYVYGDPSWELRLDKLNGLDLIRKGHELQKRLRTVGIIVSRLQACGWKNVHHTSHNVYFWKKGMSKKATVNELRQLRIGRKWVEIVDRM